MASLYLTLAFICNASSVYPSCSMWGDSNHMHSSLFYIPCLDKTIFFISCCAVRFLFLCSLFSPVLSFHICQSRASSWRKLRAGWAWTALCKSRGCQWSRTGLAAIVTAFKFVLTGKWEEISLVKTTRNLKETGECLEQLNDFLKLWERKWQKAVVSVGCYNLCWS